MAKIQTVETKIAKVSAATVDVQVNRALFSETVPRVVRWSFMLFIFTFPFEATNLGFMAGSLSIAKLSGFVFFALYFCYYSPFLGRRGFPHIPNAAWWFLGYVAVYVWAIGFLEGNALRESLLRLFTLLQALIFFWLASDLLKDERIARRVLLMFVFASAVFAVSVLLRIPGFYQEIAGRVTGVGENLNVVGRFMAIALLILIHQAVGKHIGRFAKLFFASLALPILVAMIETGSRGAIVAFMLGIAVYVLPYHRTKRAFSASLVAVSCVIAVVYLIFTTPDFLARWQETYYQEKLAGRENIFPAAMEMIEERPLGGWGPVVSGYQLGFLTNSWDSFDAHNLFLYLLLEVGLIGTIPFLIGLWCCLRSAWKARSRSMGLLPLALFVTILIGNLSGNQLVWKTQWLVLALATAEAFKVEHKLSKASNIRVMIAPRQQRYFRRLGLQVTDSGK